MASKTLTKYTFTWRGTNNRNETVKGEISATTMGLAQADLRRQGIKVKKIKKKSSPMFNFNQSSIKSMEISTFSRQMATMMSSGIPLIQSFEIVGKGTDNNSMRTLLNNVKTDVEGGCTLAEALGKHPKYFNELYVSLVEAGEKSGTLDNMLDRVASYREKLESLKGKVKKALMYPAAVIVVSIIVTVALLVLLVPQFENFFNSFNAELPFVTQVVVKISEFLQKTWWLIAGSLIAGVWAFMHFMKTSTKFRHAVERLLLKLPILGSVFKNSAIARFARTLSITFAAGLPLVDALKSVSSATGNVVFQEATLKIRDEVSTGKPLQQILRQLPMFPSMVTQMISIGEESGNLENMLAKVADYYEEMVDNTVDGLSSLIEPIIMVILGALVSGLLVAMYMPMFTMGSVV